MKDRGGEWEKLNEKEIGVELKYRRIAMKFSWVLKSVNGFVMVNKIDSGKLYETL